MPILTISEKEKRIDYLKEKILESIGGWSEKGQDNLRSYVFNSRVIYKIRDIVKSHNLDVSWGHPISDSKVGPESDIIIFRGEPEKEWNGFGQPPVIRIVFVDIKNIVLIIECKKKISIDRGNRTLIKDKDRIRNQRENYFNFGIPNNRMWLLSEKIYYENSNEKSIIINYVKNQIGYAKFFYLFDEKREKINESGWISFLSNIEQLG